MTNHRTRRFRFSTLKTLLFLSLASTRAQAATFNIADGDVAGLITAIQTANASGGSNTINLAPKGTYVLTAVADYGLGEAGATGPAGLPYIRSPLTINGNGATIQRSNATGTPDFVILEVSSSNSGDHHAYNASLILSGVTLTGASLGGLHITHGTASVQNSTITKNTGGGINDYCGKLTLLNSTVSYNTLDNAYGGGGVFLFSPCSDDPIVANISFSTIFENSNTLWGRGNAIASNWALPGSIVVKNSILASPSHPSENVCNFGGNGPPSVDATALASLGHNIAGDASCSLTRVGDLNSTNPLLGPSVNNGGPTPTDFPASNSPAIDAVPLSYCTDVVGNPVTIDQRGIARPQGPACDIGSVEYGGTYHVCLLYDSTKATPSGATHPIKLQLCDGSGNDLSSSSITLLATGVTQVSTSISGPVQSSGNANPDNDFRFDPTLGPTGGYIFNLSTKGLNTGSYNLTFTVTGNSFIYAAPFQVK